MAPKKSKKKDEDQEAEQEPEPPRTPTPLDPYQDLRYAPSPRKPQPRRKPKTTKIPVLRRRLSQLDQRGRRSESHSVKETPVTGNISSGISKGPTVVTSQGTQVSGFSGLRDKGGLNYMLLDSRAVMPPKLTPWVSPVESHMNRPRTLALQQQPRSGGSLRLLRLKNLHKEANSLAHYDQMKRQQLQLENYLMERVNRRRGSLLIRKQYVQPRVEPEGQEQRITRTERCETPPPEKPPVLSFFAYGNSANETNGLTVTMSRRQRGHNVITEWLGSPHLTDVMLKQMGLAPTTDQAVKSLEEEQQKAWQDSGCNGEGDVTASVPLFPALAVVGVSYRDILEANDAKTLFAKSPAVSPKIGEPANAEGRKQDSIKIENPRKHSKQAVPTPRVTPRQAGGVVLFFGEHRLSWCPADTKRAQQSYTVEVGCTAEYGQSAVSSTCIRNAGTVAITYNWLKCDQKDAFNLGRYSRVRFAFDCWGGVILPGETHRVPCLYKANDLGYFSEDWRLMTQPVLEAGAPIILRLWGITRDKDRSRRDRDNIELRLRSLITRTLAKHRVQKIIDHLPLREVPLKETRFPLVHLGPDLFQLKNPGLHYNSASVYRLANLIDIFDNQFSDHSKMQSSDFKESTYQSSSLLNSSDFSEMDFPRRDDSLFSQMKAESLDQVSRTGNSERDSASAAAVGGDGMAPRQKLRSSGSASLGDSEEEMGGEEADMENLSALTGGFFASITAKSMPESTEQMIKLFKRKTDLDRPVIRETPAAHEVASRVKPTKKDSVDQQGEGESSPAIVEEVKPLAKPASSRYVGSYVNIVDPNFHVDSLRRRILDFSQLDVQEAAFNVTAEEITKLSFSVQQPKENWKFTMGLTHLCHTLDSFSAYAEALKAACCMGQYQEELARRRALEEVAVEETEHASEDASDEALTAPNEASVERNSNNNLDAQKGSSAGGSPAASALSEGDEREDRSKVDEGEITSSASILAVPEYFMGKCQKCPAREFLTMERYQDQYYSRLYTRMYELLCDFFDTVGGIWEVKTELKIDQRERGIGFTKITNIHRGADMEDLLETPLPPPWIKLAQRMDTVTASNKRRMASATSPIRE